MPRFRTFDGIELAYESQGDGPPAVLHHGFATDSFINWVRPGFADLLADEGRRVVMIDARGHGLSDKPHDPAAYGEDAMARDVRALADHLELDAFDLVGYSMGAFVTLRLLIDEPRVGKGVLGGIGAAALNPAIRNRNAIADALDAEDKSTITDPTARSFRDFADLTRADKVALAAIQRAPRPDLPQALETIDRPVLVIVGHNDPIAAGAQELADRIPGAILKTTGGTHLNVVNNPAFQRAVLDFLR